MLSVDVVCVGKLSADYLKNACREYEKRIAPFYKLTVDELPEAKLLGSGAAEERRVIAAESERMMKRLAEKKGVVAALCVEGDRLDSPGFAKLMEKTAMNGSRLSFAVGGSLGLSDELKKSADYRISFSDMTFPHQLFRVMLLEQIYRAATINANVKYHK